MSINDDGVILSTTYCPLFSVLYTVVAVENVLKSTILLSTLQTNKDKWLDCGRCLNEHPLA